MLRGLPAVVVAFAAALPAFAGAGADDVDGAVAPANCWMMDGGCASRSCRSLTQPLTGAVEKAWEQTLAGEIEGDPLVWDSWAFVSVREDEGRTLYVLNLSSGAIAASKTFKGAGPLLPCLGPGLVAVRAAPDRIEVFRWRAPELIRVWTIDDVNAIESFVLLNREVYVRSDSGVARYELFRRESVWSVRARFRGRLALRGDSVYVVAYNAKDNAYLYSIARRDGDVVARVWMGHHPRGIPGRQADSDITALARRVLVRHALPIVTKSSALLNASMFRIDADGKPPASPWLLDVLGGIADCGNDSWLASVDPGEHPRLCLTTNDATGAGFTLANEKGWPELLTAPLTPSCAQDTAFFSGLAMNVRTLAVPWRSAIAPSGRMVPARGTVIFAAERTRLVALREVRQREDRPRRSASAPASFKGRVVSRDGSIVAGQVVLDAANEKFVVDVQSRRAVPLADVLLAETDDGAIVCAGPSYDDVTRGVEMLLCKETAAAWGALARLVAPSRDEDLLRRVLGETWLHGADPADAALVESRISDLALPGKVPKADPELARTVALREAELEQRHVAFIWDLIAKLPSDASPTLTIDLLRELLERSPAHAAATARVRSLLPAGLPENTPFVASEWLDFAEAVQYSPVEVVKDAEPGAVPDDGQRIYAAWRTNWRPDLIAYRSENLLIITPIQRPGVVARCLSLGDLMCRTFDGWFAGAAPKRSSAFPLTVLLYPTAEEWKQAEKDRNATFDLDWATQSYSTAERVSRVRVEGDGRDVNRVASEILYALARQWLEERCPACSPEEKSPVRRGHWTILGFSWLAVEMTYDLRGHVCRLSPYADIAYLFSSMPAERRLPWATVLGASELDYARMEHKETFALPRPFTLGKQLGFSESLVYAVQAAAVCQFLMYADDGAHRDQLARFVGTYFRGEDVSPEKCFGMSTEELGRRVREFAATFKGH